MWWKRIRLGLAWLLGLYLARMYVSMGWIKFDPEGFWTDAFQRWGYPDWLRVVIGVIETGGGVMILIPWMASYGAIGLAVVMIGAGITRSMDGRFQDVAWVAGYLAGLLWIAYEWWDWRKPAMWRRRRGEGAVT